MSSMGDGNISMTLLLTLPLDSNVSPLVPNLIDCSDNGEDDKYDDENEIIVEDMRKFNSFSFEDYAWRVYHERLLLKDPLDRYRASWYIFILGQCWWSRRNALVSSLDWFYFFSLVSVEWMMKSLHLLFLLGFVMRICIFW